MDARSTLSKVNHFAHMTLFVLFSKGQAKIKETPLLLYSSSSRSVSVHKQRLHQEDSQNPGGSRSMMAFAPSLRDINYIYPNYLRLTALQYFGYSPQLY